MVGGSLAYPFPRFPVLDESIFLQPIKSVSQAKLELRDILFPITCNAGKLVDPEVGSTPEIREITIDVLASLRKMVELFRQHGELSLKEVGDENKPAHIPEAKNIGTPDRVLWVDTLSGKEHAILDFDNIRENRSPGVYDHPPAVPIE